MRLPTVLSTARLELRMWRIDDAPAYRALIDANDAHLRPWLPFMRNEPRTPSQTEAFLADAIRLFLSDTHYRYGLWYGGQVVGEVLLLGRGGPRTMELGYWLDAGHMGLGLVTEASRVLVQAGLSLPDVDRIIIRCDVGNGPSNAIPPRLGATLEEVEHTEMAELLNVWSVT
ncbi:MAG: GNAT family N-acetyltransferase [Bradymonadia bacterium]